VEHPSTQILGNWGEDQASRYLQKQGLKIVDHQYRQKWGEIDLICRDGETWVLSK